VPVIGDPVIADPAGRVPATPVPVADVPVTAEPTARVPVTPAPVALVPTAVVLAAVVPEVVVPAVADPAARVAPTGEPETAELAAVVGALLATVAVPLAAGFGVSVALLPPHAARIALPAMLPASARNRRRLSATGRTAPVVPSIAVTIGPTFTHPSSVCPNDPKDRTPL
jgi:hypothetical protein